MNLKIQKNNMYYQRPKFAYKNSSQPKADRETYYAAKESPDDKRWCVNHPTAIWGKRSDGQWYTRCVAGNRLNESCEVGQ